MRQHRVAAPGLNLSGSHNRSSHKRWWELPLEELHEDSTIRAASPRINSPRAHSPRTNDLTGVIAKVDCRWRTKRSAEGGVGDARFETFDRKAWEDEYTRISAYIEAAYADDEGLEHEDSESYDDRSTVGQLLAHYDHDEETRRRAQRKARSDGQRMANNETSTAQPGARERGPRLMTQGGQVSAGGDGVEGRAKEDAVTRERWVHVTRTARQVGHPFSTLRASSSVGTWWPINTNAKPAWGSSSYDLAGQNIRGIIRV
mmetsp:Transcript_43774/g.115039  ORF Transcript_43774/g.115039 Transcript_43774/m.115039 type:complete len:259 (+) Transcript_43774:150-926(+)